MRLYSTKNLTKKQLQVRDLVLRDFSSFIKLVAPYFNMSSCHEDICSFLQNPDNGTHSLVLYPRGHGKSMLMGFYSCWRVIKDPRVTILYASSTATLAEAQLSFIKQVLTSDVVMKYFPDLLYREEGKREKWSQSEIKADHPIRKEYGTRDATILTAGVGKGITGLHFDLLMLDDIIAPNTEADPFSSTGREKVERWVSQAASILNAGGEVKAVGTRYHEKDIYGTFINIAEPDYDEEGNIVGEVPVYTVLERAVEEDGQYLFPRKKGRDGKYYGFDDQVLLKIKAQYVDKAQFYSQYYNNTRHTEDSVIERDSFQYYDSSNLNFFGNRWRIMNRELDIYAAIDLAATVSKRADYTAIAIVGVDTEGFRYVLDIQRKKTDKISEIAESLYYLFSKWKFVKLRAEVNAQQGMIVNQLQEYMRQRNAIFSWDKVSNKQEKMLRILSILEPLYSQKIVYHFRGGNCEILEDELLSSKPPHDDVADAVASCCELIQYVPRRRFKNVSNIQYHPRFGGVV